MSNNKATGAQDGWSNIWPEKWAKRSAILAALLLFVACARQMAPPGGPADTTPPYVVKTIPTNDSVRVGLEEAIQIYFSETMDHRSVEDAIFISPQSAVLPKFRWRGDRIEIELNEGLRPNRTYVVTIGQASADEWRNRMVASYTFRFATGEFVNQGELFGRVVWSKRYAGQAFVWLYDLHVIPEPALLTDQAHYVTQPDADGNFHFSGLGPGAYRVFAFSDGDQNKTYTPGIDALAVAPQDVILEDDVRPFRLGDMKGVVRDTSGPVLSAVRTLDQNHVLVRFNEPVRLVAEPEIGDLAIQEVYQDADSSRVGLFTANQKNGRTYDLRLSVSDVLGNVSDIQVTVRGDGTTDRRAPELLTGSPTVGAHGVQETASLVMIFSDAMAREIKQPFWVDSDSTWVPEGAFVWQAANRLVFTPKEPWPRELIQLQSDSGVLTDLNGNVWNETVRFEFSPADSQALGAIVGSVRPQVYPMVVEAQTVEGDTLVYEMMVAPHDSTFEFANVVPGRYRVSGFVDVDSNGVWTQGQASPFVVADVLFHVADTVEVRPRWTEEISRRLDALPGWFIEPDTTEVVP